MTSLDISKVNWEILNTVLDGDNDPAVEEKNKKVKEESYAFINKWKNREDYLSDPKVLKEALDEYNTWVTNDSNGGDVGYYYAYRSYADQINTDLKAKLSKIEDFSTKIHNDINFFCLRLSKVTPEVQKNFLNSEELKEYKHFLETLFDEAKHLLTENEEKIMSLKSKTAYENWVKLVEEFLSKEEREVLLDDGTKANKGYTELFSLFSSKKKEIRAGAFQQFNSIMKAAEEMAVMEINNVLEDKKVNDEIRGFSRPDEGRHLSDDVETEVVDTLVEAVTEHFDIPARYYALKAKLLGLEKLEYYERSMEYGSIEKKYSFRDSIDLVYKVYCDIDPEFGEIFKEFVEGGHMDAFPRKGKSGGAFCSYGSDTHPILILLNHTERLNDVTTIAHECGHGTNHVLMNKNQKTINRSSSKFTAECASTFMEDFVLEEILKDANDEERLSIMIQKMDDYTGTIFRQIACYNFETQLHKEYREKGFLPKEDISRIFLKHMGAYMGDGVNQTEGSELWWIYWSHIRSYFYVYSYASGLLISKSMQNSFKADRQFITKIKEFLSAGGSDSPKNIFAKLGIDVTSKAFWNQGITEIEALLDETEKLAKKLGKI